MMLVVVYVILIFFVLWLINRSYRKDMKRIDDVAKERNRIIGLISDLGAAEMTNIDNLMINNSDLKVVRDQLTLCEDLHAKRWKLFDKVSFQQMIDYKSIAVEDFYANINWLDAIEV